LGQEERKACAQFNSRFGGIEATGHVVIGNAKLFYAAVNNLVSTVDL